jgi:hypothetical protein
MTEKYIPSELRRLVVSRARNCCEYCRYPGHYSPQNLSVDHLNPRQAGGQTNADNLALSCQGCNSHKAAKIEVIDPVTGVAVALFNPRRQKWRDHFAWDEDHLQVAGLTPTGRATVEALQLNREGLMNMRYLLYVVGEHPPKGDE